MPKSTISGIKKPSRKPATGPNVENSQTIPLARPRPHQAPIGASTNRLTGITIARESAGTTTSLKRSGTTLSIARYTKDKPMTPKITGNTESA